MNNSKRFFSRFLTGAGLLMAFVGQSLVGQVTDVSIVNPDATTGYPGQPVTVTVRVDFATGSPVSGHVVVEQLFSGTVTTIIDEIVTLGDNYASTQVILPVPSFESNRVVFRAYASSLGSVLPAPDGTPAVTTDAVEHTITLQTNRPMMGFLNSVTIVVPENNGDVTVSRPLIVSAAVDPIEFSEVSTVDFFADGFKINEDPVSGAAGNFTFAWATPWVGNIRLTARATLNNGTYVETVQATRVRVHPVGSAPEAIIEAVDGTNNVVGGMNKRFTIHVNDSGSLIDRVDLYVNGEIVATRLMSEGTIPYPYQFDFVMPQYGIVEVWGMAEFSNGNRARTEVLRYVIDIGSAPEVTMLAPLHGSSFLPGSSIPLVATAYDADSLIAKVDFFVNNTFVGSVLRSEADGRFVMFQTYYVLMFAGEYSIFAQAMDESGRMARSNVVVVHAGAPDRSVPVAVFTHPHPMGGRDTFNNVSVGSDTWFNVHAFDEDGYVRAVRFFINGQLIGETSNRIGDVFAFYYRFRSPGYYFLYAHAIDNHGKIGMSESMIILVEPNEAFFPEVTMLGVDADYQDRPWSMDPLPIMAQVNAHLAGVDQLSFYANGIYVGAVKPEGSDKGVPVTATFYWTPLGFEGGGSVQITARAHQVEPNDMFTDNWVMSWNSATVRISPVSPNRAIIYYLLESLFYNQDEFLLGQEGTYRYYASIMDALDRGQRTVAELIHEIMMIPDGLDDLDGVRDARTFAKVRNALMIRWFLTGEWPTFNMLKGDMDLVARIGQPEERWGERRLVSLFMPSFQTRFNGGMKFPDGFSSTEEIAEFIDLVFKRKYGVAPTNEQKDRLVRTYRSMNVDFFLRDFILDNEAMRFGDRYISTRMGIVNPPKSALPDLADSASLFICLLRVVPSQADVVARTNLPLIEQIQMILDAMPPL